MLETAQTELVLDLALELGADFAELFFEDREDVSIRYDGGPEGVASIRVCGMGVYLMRGARGVYVYTNSAGETAILEAVRKAAALLGAEGRGGTAVRLLPVATGPADPCPVRFYPGAIGHERKIALLRDADAFARDTTPALRSVQLAYFDRDQRVRVANSEGLLAEDRRVTSRIRYVPLVSTERGVISYFSDTCAPKGFEAFDDGVHLDRMRRVILDMRDSLTAEEAPSASVPVVLEGGGCAGTFFHEACGHQLETTGLARGGLFWDRRGEKVASDKVTMVDDGTLPGMYGSARYDDEGMPRQRNVLIENGVLKGFMADRLGARRLGLPRTGSGRRQDYAHAPGARMTNTFLAAGNDDEDEMIRDMDEGLFVTSLGGGTGGREFTLMANVAFWVRGGKIRQRVKGAMLTGRGDETMLLIDRVGKRWIAEEGGGSFCGAESGFLPTTTSGPRMRIARMVVGGKGGAK